MKKKADTADMIHSRMARAMARSITGVTDGFIQQTTVAGELRINDRKYQVQVVVTADEHRFLDMHEAGPDAPV